MNNQAFLAHELKINGNDTIIDDDLKADRLVLTWDAIEDADGNKMTESQLPGTIAIAAIIFVHPGQLLTYPTALFPEVKRVNGEWLAIARPIFDHSRCPRPVDAQVQEQARNVLSNLLGVQG